MTLRIDARGTVITAPRPASVHDEPHDVAPLSVGQSGLLLRDVDSPFQEHEEHGIGSQRKEARHA
jgi:hypothetical protein